MSPRRQFRKEEESSKIEVPKPPSSLKWNEKVVYSSPNIWTFKLDNGSYVQITHNDDDVVALIKPGSASQRAVIVQSASNVWRLTTEDTTEIDGQSKVKGL